MYLCVEDTPHQIVDEYGGCVRGGVGDRRMIGEWQYIVVFW